MAVIKKGKIHGMIGKYVYRVVNVIEVVRSAPKTVTPSGNTLVENKRFGDAAKLSTKVYRLIKDFALAKAHRTFNNQWMQFINRHFFGPHKITDRKEFADWTPLPLSAVMPVNEWVKVEDILQGLSDMVIDQNLVYISIPAYEFKRKRNYMIQEADYMEYSISLIHYDFKLEQATAFAQYDSGRFLKTGSFPEQVVEFPMLVNGVPIANG